MAVATRAKRRAGEGAEFTAREVKDGRNHAARKPLGTVEPAKTAKRVTTVNIPAIDIREVDLELVGTTALIMHKQSAKAEKAIADKQGQKASAGKEARDPKAEFEAAKHLMPDGKTPGFPARAFKAAAVRAATDVGLKMVDMRRAFHVIGDLIPIKADEAIMRTDWVTIGRGIADLRYRPEYRNWSCILPIRYNACVISPEQIVNLFNHAGFGVGIGEDRPCGKSSSGIHGMFRVG